MVCGCVCMIVCALERGANEKCICHEQTRITFTFWKLIFRISSQKFSFHFSLILLPPKKMREKMCLFAPLGANNNMPHSGKPTKRARLIKIR